jgi:predicted transcriptional regulator of viral defense system
MTKKLKSINVQKRLLEMGMLIFSGLEFQRLFQVSKTAVASFLFHHCRNGLFVRLKNGLYALSTRLPSEEEIANRLYEPSYLSLDYILARHGVIPETIYTVTSVTTMPTRRFVVEGKAYEYYTIKREAYTGYRPEKINGRVALIASPEKALVDYLYFVHLKKRSLNDRLDFSRLSKKTILEYAALFQRSRFSKMVKEIL